MGEVKITVLMPVYNGAEYIAEAIESVLLQTFGDFELLIINDGSTDNTLNIINSFNDNRIVVISQENKGIGAALNKGLSLARAEYVARFDADDICYPDRLEKQYHFISSNPEYIVVGSSGEYMDAKGNHVFTYRPPGKTNQEIKKVLHSVCPFIHSSVLFRKDVISSVGYNVNAYCFQDHLLWHKIKDHGKMYNLPDSLIRVRLNPTSISMDETKRPAAFHEIKQNALKQNDISKEEGARLLNIIRKQNNRKTKEGAYYSLLAKKFLWNNYQPVKARQHVRKAISINSFNMEGYVLFMLSFLPKTVVHNLYSLFRTAK